MKCVWLLGDMIFIFKYLLIQRYEPVFQSANQIESKEHSSKIQYKQTIPNGSENKKKVQVSHFVIRFDHSSF